MAKCQGAVSIRKTVLPGMAIPMLKIRRPNGRLIFNMEIAIRRKDGLYIETGPWSFDWLLATEVILIRLLPFIWYGQPLEVHGLLLELEINVEYKFRTEF